MHNKALIRQSTAVVQRRAGNATKALEQYHQLAADLDAFRSCVDRIYMQYDPDTVTCIPPASTAEIKEQVAKLPALRERWEVAYQASTDDELAKNIGMLVAAFPNQKGADLDFFARIAVTEVAALKPSRYELTRACSQVQCSCEFLSLAALVKEIGKARKVAAWLARELKSPSRLEGRLKESLKPNQPAGEEPGAKAMAMVAAAKQRHDDEAERRAKQKVAAAAAQEDEDYEPEDE